MDILKQYLSERHILIIDPVISARVNLATCLSKLGAIRKNISLVGSMQEARAEIRLVKPKIIFSEFLIGEESGLDLIQNQKIEYGRIDPNEFLFVLVTSNASQSAVARAAEEDVDTFILKPYHLDMLRTSLEQVVLLKTNPTPYMKLIAQGKEKLFRAEYDEAIKIFAEAVPLNPHPTLAYFYSGQAEYMKKAHDDAKGKYKAGLSHNKIHYKCLIGLYELFLAQKKYTDAYDVVKIVAQYFPANPARLASVLRLAIITENFRDMEDYYEIFRHMTIRSEELIKYMCSALLVSGKHYLKTERPQKAIDLFESAAVSSAGRNQYILYSIENLVDYGLVKEATSFLDRLFSNDPIGHEYLAGKFLLATLTTELTEAIHLGRTIIRDGVEFPSVYEKLITLSVKGDYAPSAVEYLEKAKQLWPEKEEDFKRAYRNGEKQIDPANSRN